MRFVTNVQIIYQVATSSAISSAADWLVNHRQGLYIRLKKYLMIIGGVILEQAS